MYMLPCTADLHICAHDCAQQAPKICSLGVDIAAQTPTANAACSIHMLFFPFLSLGAKPNLTACSRKLSWAALVLSSCAKRSLTLLESYDMPVLMASSILFTFAIL